MYRSIGTGSPAGKGLSAGMTTILRVVKNSEVLSHEDFERFSCWLGWLHDSTRIDSEFLELFVEEILPPILRSADAFVLYENLERDKEMGVDAVRLVKLAVQETRRAVRFTTLISGLAARLLAPEEKGGGMERATGAGENKNQSRIGSTPQTT